MTKTLIITNKQDLTSDFIVKELKEREIDFYRFNTEELSKTCSITLDISNDKYILFDKVLNKEYDLTQVSSVYFRRPEMPVFNTTSMSSGEIRFLENEVLFTLEGLYKYLRNAYWVSPIFAIREAENKFFQLEIAKSIGFRIPDSIITNSYSDLLSFCSDLKEEFIIKPIKSGLIEDEVNSKVVFTNNFSLELASEQQIEFSPNLIQNRIRKMYDVRVTIVGKVTFAALIHSQEKTETKIDWRSGGCFLAHTKIELPTNVKNRCIKLLEILGLKFGAIDFVLDENNQYIFLEINPNGQWAWIERLIGYPISKEIVNLLENEM